MLSDDEETAQTISNMDEIAAADSRDRAVIAAASEALDAAGIDRRTATGLEIASAVFWWLKRNVRYVPVPGTSRLVDQTLITPCTTLAMPDPMGDCPQFSMLACAMFRVLCLDSRFVTIKAEPQFPDQWSHVYNTVEVDPGLWMPFDSSNGPSPGSEYARPYARRIWPRLSPQQCKEGPMLRSTHRHVPTGMRNMTTRMALGALQCDQDGNCYDDGVNVTGNLTLSEVQSAATPGDMIIPGLCNDPSCMMTGPAAPVQNVLNTMPPQTPSSGGFLNTLANDLTAIAAPIVRSATTQQPYIITGANGQKLLYNPATGTTSAATSSAISPTMIAVGLGVLAVIALSGRK